MSRKCKQISYLTMYENYRVGWVVKIFLLFMFSFSSDPNSNFTVEDIFNCEKVLAISCIFVIVLENKVCVYMVTKYN